MLRHWTSNWLTVVAVIVQVPVWQRTGKQVTGGDAVESVEMYFRVCGGNRQIS